jgi:glycine betaine/proline transport system permease protein
MEVKATMTTKEGIDQKRKSQTLRSKSGTERFIFRLRYPAFVIALVIVLILLSGKLTFVSSYPEAWIVPVKDWLTQFVDWLVDECSFGLFTFKELTRSLAWLASWPFTFGMGLLVKGFDLAFPGQVFGVTELHIPHLPWVAVVICAGLVGHFLQGWRLALISSACFIYLAVFGQWASAMETVSSILIAVPLGVIFGLALGILSYWSRLAEILIRPVLDMMQTIPIFAYLVPILFLFGFGPVSAMLGTVIYAVPPMVRCTHLGLKSVPDDQLEAGIICGCTPRQLFWKVKVPSAMSQIMVGMNQVIMLTLNMVIIASMIGAGGLGYDVLTALRRLQIGKGLEAGVAIVILAIALDRLSQAMAKKERHKSKSYTIWQRYSHMWLGIIVIIGTTILGAHVSAIKLYPEEWFITTAPFWDSLMSWINVHMYDFLYSLRTVLLIYVLMPFKHFLFYLPWLGVVLVLVLTAYRLGGWRLSLVVAVPSLFVVVTGYWDKAMYTVYLCGIGVIISALLGIPIAIVAAQSQRVSQALNVVLDTLQTLPAFVYLMPCVMLFRVGDVSALVAIVAYAIVPAIRYTMYGLRQVPTPVLEASTMSGAFKRQTLFKVQLPLSLPEIMLGINQTIMMALSMVVITALIGTRDLGQEVYMALTKADIGRGLVAGLGVACIATIADRLIQAYAEIKRAKLGISG